MFPIFPCVICVLYFLVFVHVSIFVYFCKDDIMLIVVHLWQLYIWLFDSRESTNLKYRYVPKRVLIVILTNSFSIIYAIKLITSGFALRPFS